MQDHLFIQPPTCFKSIFIRRFESQLRTINNSLALVWLITHFKHRWLQLVLSGFRHNQLKRAHKAHQTHTCIWTRPPAYSTEPPLTVVLAESHPTHQDQCKSLLAAGYNCWLCKKILPVLASHLPESTAGLYKQSFVCSSICVCVGGVCMSL